MRRRESDRFLRQHIPDPQGAKTIATFTIIDQHGTS